MSMLLAASGIQYVQPDTTTVLAVNFGVTTVEAISGITATPLGNAYGDENEIGYFDGTGDGFGIVRTSPPLVSIGLNEDFTLKCWVLHTGPAFKATSVIMRDTNGNISWATNSSPNRMSWFFNANTYQVLLPTYTFGTWVEAAVVRTAGVLKMFWHGTELTSVHTGSAARNQAFTIANLGVGAFSATAGSSDANSWRGSLFRPRMYKGVALHTSNYTPEGGPV